MSKTLGFWSAFAVVSGAMLGIGIFIAPPVVASHVPNAGSFFWVWLLGGFAALCGALSVAELGAMMPQAGGDYPYLQKAYGSNVAFAAAWLQLLATFPGSLAAMAVGTASFQLPVLFGEAFRQPIDFGLFTVDAAKFWAIGIVLLITTLNHIGIIFSGRVQLLLTSIPLLVFLLVSIWVVGRVGIENVTAAASSESSSSIVSSSVSMEHFARAYLPVYFAYSGWNAAIYIGGEIDKPGRNLPRAVLVGTSVVILLYMVLCSGFVAVFPVEELAHVGEAGTAAAQKMFGSLGVLLVTTLIVFAMLGSINGTVLTGSRIAYAMARKGDCFASAGRLHAVYGTPVVALWMQAGIAMVLILTNSFERLMDYASAAMLITGTLTVLAVIVLRRRMPHKPRPYRIKLYPWAPLFYACSSLTVLAILAIDGEPSVFLAISWFALALAFYSFVYVPFLRKKNRCDRSN